jgi:ABC-type Fe3+-siderophore transport system permease subunit
VSASPLSLILAFVAGALAVPIFNQPLVWLMHAAGILPLAAYNMAPTKPFGVPEIISISFWGGVWGVIFALVLPRWFSGTAYWIAAFVGGGLVLTIVFVFVVWPLKVGGLPRNLPGLFVVGFLLNAAWGIGWALLLHWFERMRSS